LQCLTRSLAEALQRLRKVPGVDEAVILSTGNRTEFYLAGFAGRPTPETVFGGLQRRLHKGDRFSCRTGR
jgi:glutamyl-tRNA reductase